jgi:beta-lactamase superfamily II metal-dependent hydrolase
MAQQRYIDEDIVKVYKLGEEQNAKSLLATLFWGDSVQVVEKVGKNWKLDFTRRIYNKTTKKYEWEKLDGAIPEKTRFRDTPILKVRIIDVCQGDAAIIESPLGKLVLMDGGESEYLYNYISAAWAHIFRYKPLDAEAIVVTHGDADHFVGLTGLLKRKRTSNQLLINAKCVYHNGLVKGPDTGKDADLFGKTKDKDGNKYVVNLVDDPRTVPDASLNTPFKDWKKALNGMAAQNPNFEVKRLAYGDDASFGFLNDEEIKVQVLGPIVEQIDGQPALRFYQGAGGGVLPSETINGHSVILKLTYGNVRFLFGADLNAKSEATLLKRSVKDNISLAAEILKVPHHGSADFDPQILKAVSPTVSVISSGDENASKEYIHPRAGLVGALGKYSNPAVEKPLIYVTEMVAFFERIGTATIQRSEATTKEDKQPFEITNVYIKKIWGIVHIRTDGNRVLVATHSGDPNKKESYAFTVDTKGKIAFEEIRTP